MSAKTHDASTSGDCGCKTSGVKAAHVDNHRSLEPVMVEFVADADSPITYIGLSTHTSYYNILTGSIISVYLSDYQADPDSFELINGY